MKSAIFAALTLTEIGTSASGSEDQMRASRRGTRLMGVDFKGVVRRPLCLGLPLIGVKRAHATRPARHASSSKVGL